MCQAFCVVNTLMNKIDKVLGLAEVRVLWKIEKTKLRGGDKSHGACRRGTCRFGMVS